MKRFLIPLGFLSFLVTFLILTFQGKLILPRYLFKLGTFELRFYSIFILAGVLISYSLARRQAKQENVNLEQVDELVFYSVVFGVIGARVLYVFSNWKFYSRNPSEILKVWHGGLSIQGAILAGIATFLIYSNFKKGITFKPLQALDIGAAYLPLGQSIGRWGNFFNYEAFGEPTNLPWKMYVPPTMRPFEFKSYDYFHPTFLYESIWNFLTFLVLKRYLERYRKRFGEVFSLYLCFYSLGRICIERFRLDSMYVGPIRLAQLLSSTLIIVGFTLYVALRGGMIDVCDR
ncbi:prolipoprotein diacylglyceryl transferase [Pseudothermotoga sp.]|nr:prolipoprotein diacylglyceryl transferase [Pseudothermotoga sp.]MCX7812331.1 prolipoprotein diacylglyceryl transferase [Pseudothermotoga sp.]MDW8139401.1 prolipoprotein diacylglyceryl transferase [Pseudothermotoga sp.]